MLQAKVRLQRIERFGGCPHGRFERSTSHVQKTAATRQQNRVTFRRQMILPVQEKNVPLSNARCVFSEIAKHSVSLRDRLSFC